MATVGQCPWMFGPAQCQRVTAGRRSRMWLRVRRHVLHFLAPVSADDSVRVRRSATTVDRRAFSCHQTPTAPGHGIAEPTQTTPGGTTWDSSWLTLGARRDARRPVPAIARTATPVARSCRSRRTAISLPFSQSCLWTACSSGACWSLACNPVSPFATSLQQVSPDTHRALQIARTRKHTNETSQEKQCTTQNTRKRAVDLLRFF